VPNSRRLGHVDVVYVKVLAFVGREREKRGAVGQLTMIMGPAGAEVCSHLQTVTF
jgi:hypothetical protein